TSALGRSAVALRRGHELPARNCAPTRTYVDHAYGASWLAMHRRVQRPGRAHRYRVRLRRYVWAVVARASAAWPAIHRNEPGKLAGRLLRTDRTTRTSRLPRQSTGRGNPAPPARTHTGEHSSAFHSG